MSESVHALMRYEILVQFNSSVQVGLCDHLNESVLVHCSVGSVPIFELLLSKDLLKLVRVFF